MKGERFPPHPLTRDECRRIIEVADTGRSRNQTGVRDQAMCVMLYRTGIRCKEMLEMMLSDVYPLEDGCLLIRIRKPKGFTRGVMPREIGMDRRAARHIFDWITIRGTSPGRLFVTRNGTRVIPQYIRSMLPKLAKRGGITRRVHAHAFRHTFARELYDEGIGLMEIMLALGHSSLKTTQTYLCSIGATEVVNVTKRRRDW